MIQITDKISHKLANLSFVCTLMVVFIHLRTSGEGCIFHFLRTYFPGAFLRMAVPAFFAISGFLLVGKCENQGWYKDALSKRLRTLMIPFVLLNVLYWPVKYLVHSCASHGASTMILSWKTPLEIWGVPFCGGPAIGPLWYVATLFYFVLVSPIFVAVIRRSCKAAVGMTALCAFALLGWEALRFAVPSVRPLGAFFYYNFSLWGLVFFVAGMAVRYWGRPIRSSTIIGLGVLGVGMAIAIACLGLNDSEAMCLLPVAALIPFVFYLMPDRRLPDCLVRNSFAIYVFHVPLIYFVDAGLKLLKVLWFVQRWYGMLLEWIVCVALAIVLAECLRRFTPKVAALFLGGR